MTQIQDVMLNTCPMCEKYFYCEHPFSPASNCLNELVREYHNSLNTQKEEEDKMSEAEKRVLKERAQSMCEEEQRATLSGIPTYLVYEEVGRRLERQGVFIDSISSIVQKHTEV